eukprot:c27252_g1_i3 orf=230-1300(+)
MPVASIEGGDLCKVWEIRTLGKVRDPEARKLLESVAKQVQPIMRKRKWRVMLLSEFCPGNPSLLGLNIGGGQQIRIRLRPHGRESEFFPYEALLGTMLHELTHNEHGPHDAKFYKLLDEITNECENLMIKGISGTGQGFDGSGKRLGGYSHNPSMSSIRQAAFAAAERRARASSLMPTGPTRLGGDSDIMRALSPVQAAAMAAERRLRDDLWCAAPETFGEDGLQRAWERESTATSTSNALSPDQNGLKANGILREAGSSRNGKQASCGTSADTEEDRSSFCDLTARGHNLAGDMWECSVCTLQNMVCHLNLQSLHYWWFVAFSSNLFDLRVCMNQTCEKKLVPIMTLFAGLFQAS